VVNLPRAVEIGPAERQGQVREFPARAAREDRHNPFHSCLSINAVVMHFILAITTQIRYTYKY
jgi:hypothetical protein